MGIFDKIAGFFEDIFGAIGDALSWLLGVPDADDYAGQLINKNSNVANLPVVYGRRLIGGTRVFVSTGGNNKNEYMYIVLALSEGEIQAINSVYVNDKLMVGTPVSGKPYRKVTGGDYKDIIWYQTFTGTDDQTACTTLFNDIGSGPDDFWGANHRLRGVAYIAMVVKYHQDKGMTSIPEIRCEIQGRKVYDPRTETTVWTSNPALCLRDYLTNERFGKGLPDSAIDDEAFGAAATFCDSTVSSYTGGPSINTFSLNMILDTGNTLFDNTKRFLLAMRGIMPYSEGKYSLIIDKDDASVGTIDESICTRDITIKSVNKNTKLNQVKAVFVNPYKRYEQDSVIWPPADSLEESTFLAEDNNQVLSKDLTLDTVTNFYQARELARVAVLASRSSSIICELVCTSEALKYAVGDIITLEQPSMGWVGPAAKEFRILSIQLAVSGEVGLTLQEYDSSIYPWVTGSEQDDQPETTLPNPNSVDAITTASVSTGSQVLNDGTIQYFADLTWTPPSDELIQDYVVKINKKVGSVTTENVETITTINNKARYILTDTNAEYGYSIQARNGAQVTSEPLTVAPVAVVTDTTAPAPIQSGTISAVEGLEVIAISWTNPTDPDFDLVNIKVSDTTTEPTEIFAQVRSNTFVHEVNEYNKTKYYWLATVDTSGNISAYTSAGPFSTGQPDYNDLTNTPTIPTIPEVAGTFYISLGDSDAPTDTEFNTAVGRDPLENDFVIVSYPDGTGTSTKGYNYNGDPLAWTEVTEYIDGSMIVTGSLSASDITTGTLNANDVTISNLTVSYSDVTSTPDLSNFITGTDVNSNVTSISGGVIQAGTAITVGTGDNVAILSGADTTYRLWAGNATASSAPFAVTQTGILSATGAIIDGNITANSLDVENATVTGTFVAPIGWSNNIYSGVINRGNLNESVKDLIDERIAEVTGGISGDFGQDDGYFSHIAQGNPDPDDPIVLNITHETGKNLTVELSGSRSWNREFVGLPDTDMGVSITLERSPAGANTWTTLTTLTDSGSSITTSRTQITGTTYAYSISIYHVLTDDQASGNYDYRARTTVAGSAYNVSIPLQLTVVEPATVGAGNADTLDNQDGTYYLDYNNFTNTPDLSIKADLSGDTFTGNVIAPSFIGRLQGAVTGAPDATIWCVSGQYTDWGIFYDEDTPDLIQFKSAGNTKASIALDNGNINTLGTITASGYNNSNWDDAYSWGDHSTQGYLTASSSYDLTGDIRVTSGSLSFYGDVHMGFIPYPNGGQFRSDSGSLTGYIKIALPDGVDNSDDMISFWVDIFDYTTSESVSLFIGGYNYQSTGNYWVNCTAQVFTKSPSKDYTVRFGFDGTRKFITIGETTSTWSHPSIVVRDFQTSFRGNVTQYRNDWQITTSTTAFSGIDETQSGNFPQASNADTLDGNHGSHYLDYNNFTNTPDLSPYLKKDGTNQTADANQFLRVGRSQDTGYCEMRLDNDTDDYIIMGSIGSNYSGVDWAGSSYLYSNRTLRIKSNAGIELFTGGHALGNRKFILDSAGNLNLSSGGFQVNGTTVIDSSRNLTNIGSITASGNIYVNSGNSGNEYLWLNKSSSGDGGILFRTDNVLKWQNVQGANSLNWYSYASSSTVLSLHDDGRLSLNGGSTSIFDGTDGISLGGANPAIGFASSASGRKQWLLYSTSAGPVSGGALRLYESDSNIDVWQIGADAPTGNYTMIFGGATSTWSSNARTTFVLGGAQTTSLLEFRNSSTHRGYIYSTGSTIEHWSAGAIDLVPSGSTSYRVRLNSNGLDSKAGILVNGSTAIDSSRNTAFAICNANSFAGGAGKIFYPSGAEYQTSASSVAGAIKIRLPQLRSNTMMRMTVKVYEYAGGDNGSSFTIELGGYNYSNGAWYNVFANIIGDTSQSLGYNVRFGEEGGYNCIWISEPTDSWAYPQVFVTEFQGGYSAYESSRWDDNWDITFATTLGSVYKIITANQIGRVCKSSLTATNFIASGSDTSPAGTPFSNTFKGVGTNRTAYFDGDGSSVSTWYGVGNTPFSAIDSTNGNMEFWVNHTNGTWYRKGKYNVDGLFLYSRLYFDDYNTSITKGSGNSIKAQTNYGYIEIAPQNGSYCHFQTDISKYYFNKRIVVDEGVVSSYNEDLILRRAESSSHQMTLNTSGATFTGNVTAYSDITLKDNITEIDNALDKVNSIRGVTYDRIDQDNARHAGVIAQEVEEVLPEVVHTDNNGIKSVAYGNMVGLLIEAIKELKSEIEELKNVNGN